MEKGSQRREGRDEEDEKRARREGLCQKEKDTNGWEKNQREK